MRQYSIVTFGCQMNMHDSERMEEVLRAAGYVAAADTAAADVILLNTCSVREKAEQKLRSEVGRLGSLKRERPELVIGVTGCVAQQEGERLLKRLPQIDVLIGPDNIAELPALLAEVEAGAPPRVRTGFDVEAPSFLLAQPELGRQGPTAFVTVMKGCNERCSFCIVPYTRGPERYRPSREICAEIARLVQAGAREVTLLGQTVNSYRDPERLLPAAPEHPDESEFPALLRAIAERVPDLLRLRYTSPHPRHLTRSLIRAHQELGVLARHVHMPVQSGSDRMLKRMIRRYDVAEYVARTDALREAVPGLTLSTDVIVGFPGETRADFERTLELVQRVGFTGCFGFKYSPRPYTPALKLGDDVPEAEKSRRLAELFELTDRLRSRHLESLVGTTQQVLVEGPGKRGYTGRTEQNEIAHFGARSDLTGRVVAVRVDQAFKNSLATSLLDPDQAVPLEAAPTRTRALPVLAQGG